ncbi:hypothetical protein P3T37_000339 [Kitasatospora sp. MAA4]|nr:hypothetical protein [Kitasatospora sp. MAA4]
MGMKMVEAKPALTVAKAGSYWVAAPAMPMTAA